MQVHAGQEGSLRRMRLPTGKRRALPGRRRGPGHTALQEVSRDQPVLLDCHSSNRTFTNASRPRGTTTIGEGGPGSCPRASCLLGRPGRHARSRGSRPSTPSPTGARRLGVSCPSSHSRSAAQLGSKPRATVGKPAAARGRPFAGLPRRTARRPWAVIPYKQESRSLRVPGDGRGSSPRQVHTCTVTRTGSALGSVPSSFGAICRLVLPRHGLEAHTSVKRTCTHHDLRIHSQPQLLLKKERDPFNQETWVPASSVWVLRPSLTGCVTLRRPLNPTCPFPGLLKDSISSSGRCVKIKCGHPRKILRTVPNTERNQNRPLHLLLSLLPLF